MKFKSMKRCSKSEAAMLDSVQPGKPYQNRTQLFNTGKFVITGYDNNYFKSGVLASFSTMIEAEMALKEMQWYPRRFERLTIESRP